MTGLVPIWALADAQRDTTQTQRCFILGISTSFGIIYFLNSIRTSYSVIMWLTSSQSNKQTQKWSKTKPSHSTKTVYTAVWKTNCLTDNIWQKLSGTISFALGHKLIYLTKQNLKTGTWHLYHFTYFQTNRFWDLVQTAFNKYNLNIELRCQNKKKKRKTTSYIICFCFLCDTKRGWSVNVTIHTARPLQQDKLV